MGVESYNLLMFPKGNQVELTEIGWEVTGVKHVPFDDMVKELSSFQSITSFSPIDIAGNVDWECYFCYRDSTSIIEFEINYGKREDQVQEISVRFAVYNGSDTYKRALMLCKLLSEKLNLCVLDMRLSEVIDFNDEVQLRRSRVKFEEKKDEFFNTFGISPDMLPKPVHCGKAFWNLLEIKRTNDE